MRFSGGGIFTPVGRRCFRESRNVAFLRIGKTGVEAGKPLVCLDRLGGEVRLPKSLVGSTGSAGSGESTDEIYST